MANTTPSQSIKLGASLQEQLGDLKGAAKTLNDEAKAAQVEVRAANREIKELEKRKKKGEDVSLTPAVNRKLALERTIEQKKQRATDLKERAKENQQFKNEVDKRFGSMEKAATGQLYSVKDSLDMVSRKLSASNGALAQSVGAKIASASAKISPSLIGTVARFAGPVGAAVAGYKVGSKYVNVQHEFRDRAMQISDIQGMTAESVAAEAKTLVNRDLPKAFLKQLNDTGAIAAKKGAGDIAREDLIQADLGAMFRDNKGVAEKVLSFANPILGDILRLLPDLKGASAKELRKETRTAARTKEAIMLRGVGELYGQGFADRISLDALMKSPEVQNKFRDYKEKDRSILEALGETGDVLLGKEEFIRKYAGVVQAGSIKGEAVGRAEEKRTAAQDPSAEAERHIRSSRRNGLERQRLRREMQWNRI